MKVWLDDIRVPPNGYTHWVKTADEAIELLKTGKVEIISLDHDLGEEKTGYTVAKFIEEQAIKGILPKLRVYVHTQNIVGKQNINMALRGAHNAWNNVKYIYKTIGD